MKKIIIAFAYLITLQIQSIAQKPLSQAAIQNFSKACEYQINYNQDNNFLLVAMIHRIGNKVGSTERAYLTMINTETDKNARELVFEAFNSICGGDIDKLNVYLYQWGLTAANAKNVAQYIDAKYNKVREESVNSIAIRKTPSGELIKTYSNGEVSYDYVQNVITNPSEIFFQGTKFFDGHIDDHYVVSIHGNKIMIKEPANGDSVLLDGIIKGGKIFTKQGLESKFRFKKSTLYYHANVKEWYVFELSID